MDAANKMGIANAKKYDDLNKETAALRALKVKIDVAKTLSVSTKSLRAEKS